MTEQTIYDDARNYDLMFDTKRDDLPFYLRQARRYGGPALELACGTGRLTIPLAEQGIQITGLDLSPAMLARAQQKAAVRNVTVEWVQADCRNFDLGKRFGLIFFPANSFLHLLSLPDVESCLACIRRHLQETGAFVFEIFNPSLPKLLREPDQRYPVGEYADGDRRLVITETAHYDTATQISHIRWYSRYTDSLDETVVDLALRIFFPQEIDALLGYNGFTLEAKYGDYEETPFTSSSQKQLLICSISPSGSPLPGSL